MKVNIGKNTLGDNNKMSVSLKEYGRSTHRLSSAWRSPMGVGTLVPFMKMVGLPGDTFEIDLCVLLPYSLRDTDILSLSPSVFFPMFTFIFYSFCNDSWLSHTVYIKGICAALITRLAMISFPICTQKSLFVSVFVAKCLS